MFEKWKSMKYYCYQVIKHWKIKQKYHARHTYARQLLQFGVRVWHLCAGAMCIILRYLHPASSRLASAGMQGHVHYVTLYFNVCLYRQIHRIYYKNIECAMHIVLVNIVIYRLTFLNDKFMKSESFLGGHGNYYKCTRVSK